MTDDNLKMEAPTTRELQKEEALKRMEFMHLSDRVISDFKEKDIVSVSWRTFRDEGNAHKKKFFVTTLEPWLDWPIKDEDISKIKKWMDEFEIREHALVYHICISYSAVSFIYVSQWREDWLEEGRKIAGECKHLVYMRNLLSDDLGGFYHSIFEPACGGVAQRIEDEMR